MASPDSIGTEQRRATERGAAMATSCRAAGRSSGPVRASWPCAACVMALREGGRATPCWFRPWQGGSVRIVGRYVAGQGVMHVKAGTPCWFRPWQGGRARIVERAAASRA
jgi:hypothetical protein